MPRKVDEWIGKTDDAAVPERVLQRLWERCKGKCQGCGVSLAGQAWDADHIVALTNGGKNRESNLQALGVRCCHRPKTKADMKLKWQISRKIRAHTGIKRARNPMPGSKRSPWKKRMDGTVERRR